MLLLVAAALPVLLGNQPAPEGCVALTAPRVNMRSNVARATSSPWVDSNAWRFLRNPDKRFCIDAPGKLSALAAAEAFAYGVAALIKTDGIEPFQTNAGLSARAAGRRFAGAREHRLRGRWHAPVWRVDESSVPAQSALPGR